ncbi:MAG: 50S ribosomal protein L10 [Phycisphaerae bacterium]|jgi:large subunit ribosomal protein L10
MSKLVKNMIAGELRSRYSELDSALWVELIGVDGNTTNAFRRDLHSKDVRLEVVRTALLRRAVADGALRTLADHLVGPAALITGGESIIDVAKMIDEWLPKIKGLRIRGALLEGQFLNEQAAAGLAKMPSKRDLQARIAGMALSPGANLAAAVLSGGGRIAGCLKSIIEKLEKEEAPAAA